MRFKDTKRSSGREDGSRKNTYLNLKIRKTFSKSNDIYGHSNSERAVGYPIEQDERVASLTEHLRAAPKIIK